MLVARYTERLTPTLLPLDGASPVALHEASPGTDASLGGSSLFITLLAVGVVLNISQHGD